jgi:hypothetical protein
MDIVGQPYRGVVPRQDDLEFHYSARSYRAVWFVNRPPVFTISKIRMAQQIEVSLGHGVEYPQQTSVQMFSIRFSPGGPWMNCPWGPSRTKDQVKPYSSTPLLDLVVVDRSSGVVVVSRSLSISESFHRSIRGAAHSVLDTPLNPTTEMDPKELFRNMAAWEVIDGCTCGAWWEPEFYPIVAGEYA